jgi:hypothetical protein
MRHYRDPNKVPLFRGSEMVRLMTMVVMLGVLGSLITRARDPHTWRWFAKDDDTVSPAMLAAQDKAHSQQRLAARKQPRQRGENLMMAQFDGGNASAPETNEASAQEQKPGEAKPAEPKPTDAKPAEAAPATAPPAAPAPPASKPGLADDVPPPEPTKAPAVPSAASSDSAPPATQVAGLADDVPPPEPAMDPDYVEKVRDFSTPPAGSSAHSSGPSTSRSLDDSENMSSGAAPQGNAPVAMVELPPIDEDQIERSDFKFECEAVTDKDVLKPEEMSAYWHLVRWMQDQNFKQMDARARRDLVFSHFHEHPDRYRGQLVRLKLRITRATAHDTEENGNAMGIKRIYDAWGCTEESSPNPYAIALVDLPADFPLKHDIQQDVTFVGYFFKLLAYKARDEKTRWAPMLIGRLVWHPESVPTTPVDMKWVWGILVGGLIIAMLAVRMTFKYQPLKHGGRLPPLNEGEENVPIEVWLDRAEHPAEPGGHAETAINPERDGDNPV